VSLKVAGEGLIGATPEEVWALMFEPEFMSRVIPGCTAIDRPREDEYKIKMVLGIPAVQGQYQGTVRIIEKEPPGFVKSSIQGQGGLGRIEGTWESRFQASGGDKCRVSYAVEVDIRGPMASMVGGFMEQVAASMMKQGFDNLSQAISAEKDKATARVPPGKAPKTGGSLISILFKSLMGALWAKLRTKPPDPR